MRDLCIGAVVLVSLLLIFIVSLPALILLSPIILGVFIIGLVLFKVFGVPPKVTLIVSNFYDWLFFKSDRPRKFMWRNFYNLLCWAFPQDEWKTMNYGYGASTEKGHSIVLLDEEESERFSYQLYHFIATGFKKLSNLQGLTVVEVGSGRGGGLAYVVRSLKPAQALGIDYSKQQVEFCTKTYKYPNIRFLEGDAENLPIEDEYADLVINVESCHCYGNFGKFVAGVKRVLKHGGIFVITDFIVAEKVEEFEAVLKDHLDIVEKKDITENVLISLRLDSERRMNLIQNRTPICCRRMLKRFSGCEGSNIYIELESKSSLYLAYKLVKKSR